MSGHAAKLASTQLHYKSLVNVVANKQTEPARGSRCSCLSSTATWHGYPAFVCRLGCDQGSATVAMTIVARVYGGLRDLCRPPPETVVEISTVAQISTLVQLKVVLHS